MIQSRNFDTYSYVFVLYCILSAFSFVKAWNARKSAVCLLFYC